MSNAEMVRFIEVGGVRVAVEGVGDSETKILDLDAGARLGYKRPRAFRQLISSLISQGVLTGVHVRHAAWQSSMPNGGVREHKVSEYWLTKEQFLQAATYSSTPSAKQVLDNLVRAFLVANEQETSSLVSSSDIAELQAKTHLLEQMNPLIDKAFKQLEYLESRNLMDESTASAHRTQLLLQYGGIDLTKAPTIQYQSIAPRDTISLNSPLIENLKSPGDLPKTGVGFNSQVDRKGFYYANNLGDEFGVSADVIGKLARAAGIFQKITTKKNEFGFEYNHPHGVEGKTKEAWMYSEKARAILRELVAQFHLSYANRPTKKTSMQTIAAAVGKEWKDKQPLVEPTVAPAPN